MRAGCRRAGWIACLAVIVLLAGCAPFGLGKHGASTLNPAQATATAAANLQGFVCANPPGSGAYDAYVDAKGQLYVVQGCGVPSQIAAPRHRHLTPIAFSTLDGWLLVWNSGLDTQTKVEDSCLAFVNLAQMAVTQTSAFCNFERSGAASSATSGFEWYSPIGWANNSALYLAETSASAGHAVTIGYVTLPGMAAVPVTKIAWVANQARANAGGSGIALVNGALYYGGYMSTGEGGAWLHRYLLGVQTDTRITPLGVAGSGSCQVAGAPCNWTGPWDISSDGKLIAYHSPGPQQSLSGADTEPGAPLLLASTAGGQPTPLFPGVALGQGFATPMFSAGGSFVAAMIGGRMMIEDVDNGQVTEAPAGLQLQSWADAPSTALVVDATAPGPQPRLALYNVVTGQITLLQAGARDYIWD